MNWEDLLPIATSTGTGALGGAAAGTVFPGIGNVVGAGIGGAIGLGTGIYDAVRRDQALADAEAQQAALAKELEQAGEVNLDLYLRDAAASQGERSQSLMQQSREAAARGGLTEGQAFGLGAESQTEVSKQAADAKASALLAGQQAAGADKANIMSKYQVSQQLKNDALSGVGSASAALGGVSGGLMQMAALKGLVGGNTKTPAPDAVEDPAWVKGEATPLLEVGGSSGAPLPTVDNSESPLLGITGMTSDQLLAGMSAPKVGITGMTSGQLGSAMNAAPTGQVPATAAPTAKPAPLAPATTASAVTPPSAVPGVPTVNLLEAAGQKSNEDFLNILRADPMMAMDEFEKNLQRLMTLTKSPEPTSPLEMK